MITSFTTGICIKAICIVVLNDFNVLVCENSNYIFANKNLDLNGTTCSLVNLNDS